MRACGQLSPPRVSSLSLSKKKAERTCKLLAVDGLAARAVVTGEVTALEHELGDDTVETRAGVAEAVLASAELAEVLRRLRHLAIEELEGDASCFRAVDGDVELKRVEMFVSTSIEVDECALCPTQHGEKAGRT